jgi:hypothetical protein
MIAQTKNVRPLNYEQELAELRKREDLLAEEALIAPTDEMLSEFQQIWSRREQILKEIEMNIPPLPVSLPLSEETSEYVINMKPCSLAELRAIPRPGNWVFIRDTFKSSYWWCKGVSGHHTLLPVSVINQYGLTLRQVLILEGVIKVEKQPLITTEPAHEIQESNSIDQGYEKYFYSRSW